MNIVSDLQASLAREGENVVLRRKVAGTPVDVAVRAAVRVKTVPNALISGTVQDDYYVVMGMTEIRAAGWPGTGLVGTAPFVVDSQVPMRGDMMIIKGNAARVERVNDIAVNGVVVRCNITARGRAGGA